MKSLDLACAKAGHEIAEAATNNDEAENILRKSLGTLQEMGIYAHLLFLANQKKNKQIHPDAKIIINKEIELLSCAEIYGIQNFPDTTQEYQLTDIFNSYEAAFGDNVSLLFAAKDMLERTLTYALYELKSKDGDQ